LRPVIRPQLFQQRCAQALAETSRAKPDAQAKRGPLPGSRPAMVTSAPTASRGQSYRHMVEPVPEFQEHGLGVTSALLFGTYSLLKNQYRK
jgi:hypothetical protein